MLMLMLFRIAENGLVPFSLLSSKTPDHPIAAGVNT